MLSEVADVTYKCSTYYDGASSAASPTTTPTSGSPGREDMALLVSERDMHAPALREIAGELPF